MTVQEVEAAGAVRSGPTRLAASTASQMNQHGGALKSRFSVMILLTANTGDGGEKKPLLEHLQEEDEPSPGRRQLLLFFLVGKP